MGTQHASNGHAESYSARASLVDVLLLPDLRDVAYYATFTMLAAGHGWMKQSSRANGRHGGGSEVRCLRGNARAWFGNTKTTRRLWRGKMSMYDSSAPDAAVVDVHDRKNEDALLSQSIFPFLKLPRELRDQVCTVTL